MKQPSPLPAQMVYYPGEIEHEGWERARNIQIKEWERPSAICCNPLWDRSLKYGLNFEYGKGWELWAPIKAHAPSWFKQALTVMTMDAQIVVKSVTTNIFQLLLEQIMVLCVPIWLLLAFVYGCCALQMRREYTYWGFLVSNRYT